MLCSPRPVCSLLCSVDMITLLYLLINVSSAELKNAIQPSNIYGTFAGARRMLQVYFFLFQLLQFKLNTGQMTFSTLDIDKGDFESLSDNEESEKQPDIDLELTSSISNSSTKSGSNSVSHYTGVSSGMVNGVSSGAKPKRLTSMEMDAEDEPL